VRAFFSTKGYDFLGELEDKYDCASVCTLPLFYINKEISEGKPEKECIQGMYDGIKGAMKAEAIFIIIGAIALFIAMTAAVIIACTPDEIIEKIK